MRRANLPPSLRSAVLAHHRHRWARTLCIDERAITRDLTAPLRMDLALFVHRAAFERVKVFAALPRSTARRLAVWKSTTGLGGPDQT